MVIQQLFCLQIAIQPFNQLYPNLTNGNSETVLSPKCHLAVQTKTQMQTEPEVFRKHHNSKLLITAFNYNCCGVWFHRAVDFLSSFATS